MTRKLVRQFHVLHFQSTQPLLSSFKRHSEQRMNGWANAFVIFTTSNDYLALFIPMPLSADWLMLQL